MSKVLKDPSKAAHEIIEVLEDGDAIRNDGVRLTAAKKNPWYVLATIYGEQEVGADRWNYDKELAVKNRRAWNGWFCGGLSDEERQDRAQKTGLAPDDLAPLSMAELDEIKNLFVTRMGVDAKLPDHGEAINFSKTIFSKHLCFKNMVFEKGVSFNFAMFESFSNFRSAVFNDSAHFSSAVFHGSVGFSFTAFSGNVHFSLVLFRGSAYFDSVMFNGSAHFSFTVFSRHASFDSAVFRGSADFSSAKFKSTTHFTKVRFLTHVPEFHAAELYDDTVFPIPEKYTDNWPPLKGEGIMPAADQKRAYNRLRLFMNRSLQIDEEQFFHRQEMRCKAVLAKLYHKPLYWLFAALSDYGNSVWRPIAWGALSVAAAAVFMLWWQGVFAFMPREAGMDWTFGLLGKEDTLAATHKAFGWSISNTLPFLGSGKYFTSDEFTQDMSAWLKFIGWVQTLFGYILLFFLGLGLRNRFRLR